MVEPTFNERSEGSIELFFSVGLDGAIGGGVSHARQHEACFDLIVVQEALVGLINGASGDFSGAGGASASAAGVRQINALLFCCVEDVLIIRDFDGLVETFALADQGDLVGSHGMVNTTGSGKSGPAEQHLSTANEGPIRGFEPLREAGPI